MPPVGFEPTISAGERPQTYALDRAATGAGFRKNYTDYNELGFCVILLSSSELTPRWFIITFANSFSSVS